MKRLFLLLLLLSVSLEAKQAKPNIILLMGDDHGWEEVGYNGHPYVKTPYIDEMAAAGLRLDNFYAQPSCSPTRGSVLTGRHPNRYGIFRPGYSIRPEEVTLAHLLKDAGYATAHFGKWHVGPIRNNHHPKITENDFHGARAIISGDYKLVIDGDKNTGTELFDLRKDSAERNNLANSQAVIAKKLQEEMREWQTSVLNSLMEADYKKKNQR